MKVHGDLNRATCNSLCRTLNSAALPICSPQLFSVRVRNCSDVWWSWDLVGSTFGYSMIANSKARQNFGISYLSFQFPENWWTWHAKPSRPCWNSPIMTFTGKRQWRSVETKRHGFEVFTGVVFSALQLRSENLSGWWRAALQGECWKTKARPGRPGRGRMEKTYVNKTSTKNPKQHKALHVSLCFSCILILSFTDYLIIWFVSR